MTINNTHVGIEIEAENIIRTQLTEPHTQEFREFIPQWSAVRDGSLRDHGAEFVSTKLPFNTLRPALDRLILQLHTQREQPRFSHRCSVHVHVDVSTLTFQELKDFVTLYCIFEEPLFAISGQRNDNEYCIPIYSSLGAKHALAALLCTRPDGWGLSQDTNVNRLQVFGGFVKYIALNLQPIHRQGSVEFRHHEGTLDPDTIINWVYALLKLRQFAIDFPFKGKIPYEILCDVGPDAFIDLVWGDVPLPRTVRRGLSNSLFKGARVAQDIYLYTALNQTNKKYSKTSTLDKMYASFLALAQPGLNDKEKDALLRSKEKQYNLDDINITTTNVTVDELYTDEWHRGQDR